MPRYFFDVVDGHLITDDNGTELQDVVAARSLALAIAGELSRDVPKALWRRHDWKVSVRDSAGAILFEHPVISEPAVVLPLKTKAQPEAD